MSPGLSNITAETTFDLSSDHNPLLYTFNPDFNFSYSHNCTTFTNWNKFQLLLHSSVPGNPSINNEDDINFAVSNLTEKIHASINQSSITKHIKHQITFIPLSNRMKIREKNRLRKLWQFCRYPPLKAELNKLQKAIRKELKIHKEHVWDEILSDVNIDPNAIHKLIARKRKPVIIPPFLGYHGLIYNIQDKANLFMEKTDLQKPPLQNQVQILTKTGRTPKPTLLQINPIQSKLEMAFPPIPTATTYIWLPYLVHGGSNPPQRTPNNTEHRPQTNTECSTLHPQEIHPC
ncbi:RNA-directed DNA polymerase from mobile element jockey [Trichonephila clavata]|uniref:RNA-directed DNA polymerase from mobile element jockey n=1 Tax=Trichonephila clavata TaxID=2740835 RepID=A0A8X6LFB5_TRICU|nr:RNA-directed DNA polymerase from mobile element jockey [Trichonephila clavata]